MKWEKTRRKRRKLSSYLVLLLVLSILCGIEVAMPKRVLTKVLMPMRKNLVLPTFLDLAQLQASNVSVLKKRRVGQRKKSRKRGELESFPTMCEFEVPMDSEVPSAPSHCATLPIFVVLAWLHACNTGMKRRRRVAVMSPKRGGRPALSIVRETAEAGVLTWTWTTQRVMVLMKQTHCPILLALHEVDLEQTVTRTQAQTRTNLKMTWLCPGWETLDASWMRLSRRFVAAMFPQILAH
jgi:hypothetical protein